MKMDIESFQEQLTKEYSEALKRHFKAIEWFFSKDVRDQARKSNQLVADQGRIGEFAEDAHFWPSGK